MKSFNSHCQGESHKLINKVCQDYSYSAVENGIAIAIVCDGHGGNRYFRSDVGAKFATEIAKENTLNFVKNVDKNLFLTQPFTSQTAIQTEINSGIFEKSTQQKKVFRQLFSSIISGWQTAIENHANENPLTEIEKQTVEKKYLNEFETQTCIEKTYGCTLMVYVQTSDFWFAFHIGDGKCISLDENSIWKEPIPWDERCFLNKTTSLCSSDAINEFRYCYCGDGSFPIIVFLGSDGIDDSFGEELNLVNFYIQIAKEFATKPFEVVTSEIEQILPRLSKIGSQDDMSLALILDENNIKKLKSKLIDWQISKTESDIKKKNVEIQNLQDVRDEFLKRRILSQKDTIEFNYAKNDIEKAFAEKEDLVRKINCFLEDRDSENFTRYRDEVGSQDKCRYCGLKDICLKRN